MSQVIRTLVTLDSDADKEAVHAALPVDSDIHVVGIVDGLDEAWQTMQETPSDLLVVACGGYSDRALFLIDAATKQRSDRPVVVLCDGSPNGFVRRVFEAGADDIVTLPASRDEMRFALEKAVARKQGSVAGAGVAVSPMICVLGPKGGTGKTLTTCNLAVSLADGGNKVVVLDLDLQFGDVGLSLGLTPDKTLYDLAKSAGSLDAEKLDGFFTRHESGIDVLMAPTRPDHAAAVTVEFLRELYTTLRAMSDYVIVDTPPGFTPEVIASIDSSSHICMVGMLDSLSLKNTKLGLETLELMGYDTDRVRLVLNRADSRVGITKDDVLAIVGRAPDILVPSDRDIPRSVNEGRPITRVKPRSDAARAFQALAGMYRIGRPEPEANGRRRLLGRKR